MAKKKPAPAAVASTGPSELDGTDLEKFVSRTHPGYKGKIDHWRFCRVSYVGGREWFAQEDDQKPNLFKFYKEGEQEYQDRVDRTYRANHTKRVVDTVNQYLFRSAPVRSDVAPTLIKRFWANCDGKGGHINRLAKDLDRWMSVYGRIWVGVDRPQVLANTRQEELKTLPYAYVVGPERVLDYSISSLDGHLNWILIEEELRDDSLDGDGGGTDIRWRLWTRTAWYLIRLGDKKAGEGKYVIDSAAIHALDMVPFVSISDNDTDKFTSPALVDDIVYMDRTLVNYGSLLDEILYEQTFSTLTLPVEGVLPGTADYNKIINASKNRLFLFSSTAAGGKPEFISPDAAQANLLVGAMEILKKDIYAVTGTDNDANTQSMSKGKEYASGKVREFDHKQIENILLDKARALESGEERILRLVLAWMGDSTEVEENWVTYPDKFDVRGLASELDIAGAMNELKLPAEMMRRQAKLVAAKAFTRLTAQEKSELETIIDKWMPGYEQEMKLLEREVAATEKGADATMITAKKPAPKPVAAKAPSKGKSK